MLVSALAGRLGQVHRACVGRTAQRPALLPHAPQTRGAPTCSLGVAAVCVHPQLPLQLVHSQALGVKVHKVREASNVAAGQEGVGGQAGCGWHRRWLTLGLG